jgi:DNA-binding XRE family transcriptional regulator
MASQSADPGGTSPGPAQAGADDAELRKQIRELIRDAREKQRLTQVELGKRVGVSRFTINRIEAGATDITPALAESIEQTLELPELRTLVARRDGLSPLPGNGRDAVVARLLGAHRLQRLRVVLADQTDVYSLMYTWVDGDSQLRADDVEIVVPTVKREREMLGVGNLLHGHIEYQIKRLLDLKKSDHYAANSLRLYESDNVVGSLVIAETAAGVEAATWPPLILRGAAILPVGVTADGQAVAYLHSHVDRLIRGHEPIRSNEAVCRVPFSDTSKGPSFPVFTRYFTVGEDQEEDIDDREGIAVALVLVTALAPRRLHGVGRRVITYMRSNSRQDRRRSLFSNTVEDVDIQRARALAQGLPPSEDRSTRGALAAALDVNDYLESQAEIIPDTAFQMAAAREMSMFGLTVDPDRFQPVSLPSTLQLIRKPASDGRRRAAIAPRLFVLDLKSDQPEPELAALQVNADVEEVGKADLMHDSDLNDFLLEARDSGFLASLLEHHQLVDR